VIARAAITAILFAVASCQTFDFATIRPSRAKGGGGLDAAPGTLTIHNLPLRMIIAAAHGIAEYQIAGPQLLKEERFDIVVKTAAPVAGREEMLPLLQPLLAERCRLAMHRETRELSAYVLGVARNGPKLEPPGTDSAPVSFKKADKSYGSRLRLAHVIMSEFADILSRRLGRPVRDMTGIAGAFRLDLEWSADEKLAKPGGNAKPAMPGKSRRGDDLATIFTALQEQIGLRLESGKAPVEIYVIDHIEKAPIAN
jgi:uncharacterized protein (TIGR03435 family)